MSSAMPAVESDVLGFHMDIDSERVDLHATIEMHSGRCDAVAEVFFGPVAVVEWRRRDQGMRNSVRGSPTRA